MHYAFNAAEVFDVAIQIELNGVAFYRKAAQYASDEAFRKELLGLGEMEQEHVARFTELKRDLVGEQGEAEWFDPAGEAARYLEAFAAGNVFNVTDDASKALTEQPSARDILDFANEAGVDLIVIASHDPGLADYLLGSVAARVVRHAHCSVFVTRNLE